jgi:hypothetical protein
MANDTGKRWTMADPENVADNAEDIVVSDQDLYDHATSDVPASTPESQAPAEAQAPEPEPQAQPDERPRDEHGRFAPKLDPRVRGDATTQQPAQTEQPPAQQQRQPEDHRVPLAELHRERERAQRAEAEANQMRQAWAQWQQMQALQAQQAQQAQQPQQPPQTIFDNPDDWIRQNVVQPLQQEMHVREMQRTDKMSRRFANHQFGTQAVETALNDLTRIRNTPQGDAIFNQIMNDGHPYGALVEWHKEAVAEYQRRREIGSDVNAWKQKYGEQLLNDPRWQAAAIERARAAQQQQGNGNRPPNVQLPPSLSSMPASSGRLEDQGDLSNDSLYRFATK